MTFGNRIAAIMSVVLLASFGTMIAITLSDLRDDMRQRQGAALKTVGLTLRSTLERNGNTALALAQVFALQPGNVSAVANSDRRAILERLQPVYAYLSKQNGVEMLQFQSADLKMFLRVQEPENFGDDVAPSRPMVVAVNHSHTGQSGVELGRRGLALRGVAPIMDGATLVGTAEVGLGLPDLIRAVKTRTGAEVAVVLSVGMGAQQGDKKVHGDLFVNESTDNTLFARLLEAASPRLAREDTFGEAVLDDATWGIVVTPLLDYSGRMIGGFVAAANFTTLHASYWRQAWKLLFVAFAAVVVCFSVIAVAMKSFVARPLQVLGDWLEALAEGRQAGSAVPPPGAADSDRIVKAATALAGRVVSDSADAKEPAT